VDDYYFSLQIDEHRTLCLAPLTDRNIELSGEAIADQSGYFLYEKTGSAEAGNVQIIAQVHTAEAAFRLRDMLRLS
jgi:hypothetical protein